MSGKLGMEAPDGPTVGKARGKKQERGGVGRWRLRGGLQLGFPVNWKLTLSKVATKSKTRMRMWRAETTNRRSDMAARCLAQSGSTQSWGKRAEV